MISSTDLSSNEIVDKNLNIHYIDIQLLMFITLSENLGTNTFYTYNRENKMSSDINFTRLLLCRSIASERYIFCYLMEARNKNICLWDCNTESQDHGVLAMETVICILAPLPIDNITAGNVRLVKIQFLVIVMQHPLQLLEIKIDYE